MIRQHLAASTPVVDVAGGNGQLLHERSIGICRHMGFEAMDYLAPLVPAPEASSSRWVAEAITFASTYVPYLMVMAWALSWRVTSSNSTFRASAPQLPPEPQLVAQLKAMPPIEDVHHLHVWQPDESRTALEGQLTVSERDLAAVTELKEQIKTQLKEQFAIDHATLEFEIASHVHHSRNFLQDK